MEVSYPSREYLRLLDELLECRDDVSLNLIQNKLKQLIDSENVRFAQISPLIERYKSGVMTFHVHGLLRFGSVKRSQRSHRRGRVNFCATIQSGIACTAQSTGVSNTLVLPNSRLGQMKASVLVDVRQMGKKTQSVIDGSNPIVGLHTLDECKRNIGNPRKLAGEFSFRERSCLSRFKRSGSKGEFAMFLPVGVNGGNVRISLDEIEYEMIQGRAHMVNNFARQKRDLDGGGLGHVQLLFALRLSDNFVRFSSGICGDVTLQRAELFRCPDQFNFRRFNSVCHSEFSKGTHETVAPSRCTG